MSWGSVLIKGSPESLIRDIYVTLTGDILKAEGDITILDLLKVIYPKEEDIRKIKSVIELEEKLEQTYQDTSEDSAKLRKLKEELKDARTNVQLFQKVKQREQAYDRAKTFAARNKPKNPFTGRPRIEPQKRTDVTISVNDALGLLQEAKRKVQGKDLKTEEKKVKSLTSKIKTLEGKINPQGRYFETREETKKVGLEPRKLRGKTKTRPNIMNILNRVLANENKLKATTKKKVSKRRINSSVKRYEEFLEEYKDLIENETGEYDDDAFNDSLLEYKKQLDMFSKEIVTVSSIRKLLSKEKTNLSKLEKKLKKIPKEEENKYFAAFIKVKLSEGRIKEYSKALKEAEAISETKEIDSPLDELILLNLNLVATAFQEVSDAVTSLAFKFEGDEEASRKIKKVVELLQKGGSKLKELQKEGQKIEEKYDTVMEIIFDDGERKRAVTKPRIPMGGVSFRDDGRRKVTSPIKIQGRGSIPTNYLKYLKLLAQVATAYSPRDSKLKTNRKLSKFFELPASYPFLSKLVQAIRDDKKDVAKEFYSTDVKGSELIRVPRYMSFQARYDEIGKNLDTILDKFEQKPEIISAMSAYAENILKKPALKSPTKVDLLDFLNDEKDRLEETRKAKRQLPRGTRRIFTDIKQLPKINFSELLRIEKLRNTLYSDAPNEALEKLLLFEDEYKKERGRLLREKRELSRELKEEFTNFSKGQRQRVYTNLVKEFGEKLKIKDIESLTSDQKRDLMHLFIVSRPKMLRLDEELEEATDEALNRVEDDELYKSLDIIFAIIKKMDKKGFEIPSDVIEDLTSDKDRIDEKQFKEFLDTHFKGLKEFIRAGEEKAFELDAEIKSVSKRGQELRRAIRNMKADEEYDMNFETLRSVPGFKISLPEGKKDISRVKPEDLVIERITDERLAASKKPEYVDIAVQSLYEELGKLNKQLKYFKKWAAFYDAVLKGKYDDALEGTIYAKENKEGDE
jgi:methyl-accepting chemotaxis protein|tara:strand:+ start:172 stop:3081 length:2910 start_codon:yes stop_codon:yes gene_type:complete